MESSMRTILFAAGVALALSGCAAVIDADHAAHHPTDGAAAATAAKADMQMKTMQEMHQRMMAAKTPEERQALMAEHMKSMQGGMSMMCEMSSGGGMGMQGGAGSSDMMKRCMDMKAMCMQMMMDRDPAKSPAAK
jgi:uncharacterized protein YceK